MEYNIYCDESCHLPNDTSKVMVLGATWCMKDQVRTISKDIQKIKSQHNLSRNFEVKWNKISEGKKPFYLDLINYFFSNPHLHFRCLVVPDKTLLRHEEFDQDHDLFYYKMFFTMLRAILSPEHTYNIYLDIKDTKGSERINKLREYLSNDMRDFDRNIIRKIQHVHSHEVSQIQITDLLIGAVSYLNRGLTASSSKIETIELIKKHSGYSLTRSTLLRENKFNIFRWKADMGDN